jgi:hypothetical protein
MEELKRNDQKYQQFKNRLQNDFQKELNYALNKST